MKHTKFVVSSFENRNGTISWRVDGYLNGVRIRRNFKTREEAAAEKSALEIQAAQTVSGIRTVATSLTAEQVREAEAVFQRLRSQPCGLSFYVDFALHNYKKPDQQKRLSAACADYVAAKQWELDQDQLSVPQMRHIRWEMKRLTDHFATQSVAEVTSNALIAFLEPGKAGMKTHNNRRGLLSTFFKFCFQRGWTAENPIAKVPHYRFRRKRGSAPTLSIAQVRAVMEFAETHQGGVLVPYFALCLFAGIRPGVPYGEITRLKPEMIDLDAGVINIPPEVSKVRESRRTTIQPNLAAWLRTYPLKDCAIMVGNFKKRRQKFGKQLGLSHDVMRHTFISMFVAKFRSIGEAAIQAGNSESIIRKHYLDLKSPEEAEQFFAILPKHGRPQESDGKVVALVPAPELSAAM
jgi:integrase